jgi:hypothetical protein
MRNIILKYITFAAVSLLMLGACVNDLDVEPIDPRLSTPDKVYDSEEAFFQVLSKIYAGFATSGQQGPAGDGDLGGFDEGHSQYWRGYFVVQELPTDECVNGWADGNLPKMSQMTWAANNEFIRSFYYRALYQVSVANEFIRQANTYGKPEYTNLPQYIAEARFLRALAYWHALDLFGNGIPFVTEEDEVGATLPQPAGDSPRGPELFNYIESELLDIVGDGEGDTDQILLNPRQGYVGQADKAAAWMLLTKLYLNHKTYLGSEDNTYYTKARTYVNKVINDGGYSLITDADATIDDVYSPYEFLFLADNYRSDNEIIFSINYDGVNSQTWGGMTYVVNAAIGGEMSADDFGTNGGWGGNRTTKALVEKFADGDARALWFTEGQSLDILNQDQFTDGYAVVKYKNRTRDGGYGRNGAENDDGVMQATSPFVDINVPVFRLADAYLMAAEIDLRLDGAVSSANLNRLNEITTRAGVSFPATVDLDYILDERARELYWECHRRTDLIRFDKFTSGDYVWPLKGNDLNGKAVDDKFNLMPIPFTDITANPNLKQNPNY